MSTSPHHPFPSKLTLDDAEQIRARHAAGDAPRALAAEYGVAVSSVYDVLRGRAHPPRITLPISSVVLARLRTAALRAGVADETLAAALLEGALASLQDR
jgi:hypothetical protein